MFGTLNQKECNRYRGNAHMSKIPSFNRDSTTIPTHYNRGFDQKLPADIVEPVKVGLYTIDNAILKYLQTTIAPIVTQNDKQIQVPVIYGNPERWKSVQRDGFLRDNNGKIQLPIIMLRRTGMKKNGINSPVNKYQQYSFKSGWNSRNIYDKFSALNKLNPPEMYHMATVPDFYDVTYEAMVWTEYMEQMNKIVENISFEDQEYWGEDNDYKFISRITSYDQLSELPTNNDRVVRSKFTIDVRGYILPDSQLNKDGKREITTKIQYSPKQIVFSSEVVSELP